MKNYIIRRFFQFIPVLIGVSILIFILMRIVPGDVALMILIGPEGTGEVDPIQLEALRDELGLNRPLPVQYFTWVGGMLKGDFGHSLRTDIPVFDEIRTRFPLTFEIATLTVLLSMSIALPLGIIMAMRQDTWIDYIARIVTIGGLAMPNFWVATLMLLFMVIWFNWIPPLGYEHIWDDPWANFQQVIWGALGLGYLLAAVVARMTRSTLLEVLRQDYIRTAWAKGLRERSVVVRHALKNALLPVVTIVGLQYAALIGGTVIMEQIWNLPGLGQSLIVSINSRDFPMVQALVMLFAIIILFANLIVDLLYAWLDPRVRYG
ncbi:MAG: ABC transporter permease [Chloroflexi bacterium]|nr:ABC transporter permease [Chloroflexota bacterium]